MKFNEYDYIKGSTAVKPQRAPKKEDKKNKELKKKRELEKRKKILEKERKNRASVFQIVIAILLVGGLVIWRDMEVYSARDQLSEIKSQIKEVNSENEALRVELLKISSLDTVKESAENDLNMKMPQKEDRIKVNLDENNFEEATSTKENASNEGIVSKIMDALF